MKEKRIIYFIGFQGSLILTTVAKNKITA